MSKKVELRVIHIIGIVLGSMSAGMLVLSILQQIGG